ncbi:MAG: hypothetical protein IKM31_08025 [Oscillospiraceae bacterium]|nr:hypothetical protein [Oscillospiraceae bacterium]
MKKGIWLSIIAGAAAVAAASVAAAAFIKRKSEALSDQLDYDPDEYFEGEEEEVIVEITEDEPAEEAPAEEPEAACECAECTAEDCTVCPSDAPAEEEKPAE